MLEENLLPCALTDPAEITRYLPQRAPFVMADKLLSVSEKEVKAGLTVTADNVLVTAGSLSAAGLTEHMAQTVALHAGYHGSLQDDTQSARIGYLAAVKKLTVNRLPAVGESLLTVGIVLHEIAGMTTVGLITRSKEEIIAEAQMITVLAQE